MYIYIHIFLFINELAGSRSGYSRLWIEGVTKL